MEASTPLQFYFSNECGQHHDAPPTNFVPEPASSHRGAWDASSRRMYDTVLAPDDDFTAWATFAASRQRWIPSTTADGHTAFTCTLLPESQLVTERELTNWWTPRVHRHSTVESVRAELTRRPTKLPLCHAPRRVPPPRKR